MSYRGAPLDVLSYIRDMDERIRSLTANAGTTRVPSQRIGGFIIEIDDLIPDTPRIKLTEVETGDITYCCVPSAEEDALCPQIPPFTWYGPVDMTATFPGFPVANQMVLVELAVVQETVDNFTVQILVNNNSIGAVLVDDVYIQRYDIPNQIVQTNDVVSLRVSSFGGGDAENVVFVLRTCLTPQVAYSI